LGFEPTDEQITKAVKVIEDYIPDEQKAELKFGGAYTRLCKQHPHSGIRIKLSEDSNSLHKWYYSICGNELVMIPNYSLRKVRKELGEEIELPEDQDELLDKVKSGEIDFNSLTPGKKAWVTRLRRKMENK